MLGKNNDDTLDLSIVADVVKSVVARRLYVRVFVCVWMRVRNKKYYRDFQADFIPLLLQSMRVIS